MEPNLIGVASGLLFALPAIRNTQSGAPPLGCTADVSRFVFVSHISHRRPLTCSTTLFNNSFFWCMPLTAFSVFLLMINYIVSYKREKKKTA